MAAKKSRNANIAENNNFCNLNDLIHLENDSHCITQEKGLKDSILGKQWLNSDHMNSVNILLQQTGYSVNGLQDTMLAAVLKIMVHDIDQLRDLRVRFHHQQILITIAKTTG